MPKQQQKNSSAGQTLCCNKQLKVVKFQGNLLNVALSLADVILLNIFFPLLTITDESQDTGGSLMLNAGGIVKMYP